VEWLSFDLHPEYPPEGIPRAELEARYGKRFSAGLEDMFAEAGLPFRRSLEKVPNSRKALMLSELARERGRLDLLHPRLFAAYWAEGRDLGDEQVLVEEGVGVGLEEDEVRAALHDERLLRLVQEQTEGATELGAGGVPAWVIDRKVLVPGAQPHEVFDQILARLGYRPLAGAES
jgi:predicted DsbA family dithiol-disulfide isomerase